MVHRHLEEEFDNAKELARLGNFAEALVILERLPGVMDKGDVLNYGFFCSAVAEESARCQLEQGALALYLDSHLKKLWYQTLGLASQGRFTRVQRPWDEFPPQAKVNRVLRLLGLAPMRDQLSDEFEQFVHPYVEKLQGLSQRHCRIFEDKPGVTFIREGESLEEAKMRLLTTDKYFMKMYSALCEPLLAPYYESAIKPRIKI